MHFPAQCHQNGENTMYMLHFSDECLHSDVFERKIILWPNEYKK